MQINGLSLDRPAHEDIDAVHAIYGDPRVWTHLPSGCHQERTTTATMVEYWMAGWERDGLSVWILRDSDGVVIGNAGCMIRAGTFWNLSYRLAWGTHGRGYASAVSQAAVQAATEHRPDLPVVAYMLEHNPASARVAEKAGLRRQYRGPDAGNPDPQAVRLVYADRELTPEVLQAVLK